MRHHAVAPLAYTFCMDIALFIGGGVSIAAGFLAAKLRVRLWLRRFRQGAPAEAVVILGHGKPWSWLVADYEKSDLESVVGFLERRGREFSFYVHPGADQVRCIMADKRVREVFFVGHGSSHFFRLRRGEILYYCAFADAGLYGKELVHQVHCGGSAGINLIERVVPVENRHKCFYFDRKIKSRDIEAGFERLAGFWGERHNAGCQLWPATDGAQV